MSIRRPSNASNSVAGPRWPMNCVVPSTSTMGNRRRAAAIASPSRVCAFSRTRSASSSAWKVLRSTTAGTPNSFLMASCIVPLPSARNLGQSSLPSCRRIANLGENDGLHSELPGIATERDVCPGSFSTEAANSAVRAPISASLQKRCKVLLRIWSRWANRRH